MRRGVVKFQIKRGSKVVCTETLPVEIPDEAKGNEPRFVVRAIRAKFECKANEQLCILDFTESL